MWTSVTQDQIDDLAVQAFLPIVLLLNYTLFLYLAMFYWKRRREGRVILLLFIGALGTIVIIPFAVPDQTFVEAVNDTSESCCVLTFLLQITIIGYDLNKKFKIRSVIYLTYVAEVLILADLASILLSCIVVFAPHVVSETTGQIISNAAENTNLAFIFIFRFYYIGISRGWRSIVQTRKFEMCCYVLFATHELPFDIVSDLSGLNWEFAQAIWHRTTLTACLLITAKTKIKQFSGATTNSAAVSRGHASSANSGREQRSSQKSVGVRDFMGPNIRRVFAGNASPRLDLLQKPSGRRNSGVQTCTVAPKKQLDAQ